MSGLIKIHDSNWMVDFEVVQITFWVQQAYEMENVVLGKLPRMINFSVFYWSFVDVPVKFFPQACFRFKTCLSLIII